MLWLFRAQETLRDLVNLDLLDKTADPVTMTFEGVSHFRHGVLYADLVKDTAAETIVSRTGKSWVL